MFKFSLSPLRVWPLIHVLNDRSRKNNRVVKPNEGDSLELCVYVSLSSSNFFNNLMPKYCYFGFGQPYGSEQIDTQRKMVEREKKKGLSYMRQSLL